MEMTLVKQLLYRCLAMAQDFLDLIHTQSNEIAHYFPTGDTSHLKFNRNKKSL